MTNAQQNWEAPFMNLRFSDRGRSWKGVDCYGLVYLVYKEIAGVLLPTFDDYSSCSSAIEIEPIVFTEKPKWEKVETPKPLDVAVFNIKGHPVHVGVMLDSVRFIHAMKGRNVTRERITHPLWARRVDGVFRKCN